MRRFLLCGIGLIALPVWAQAPMSVPNVNISVGTSHSPTDLANSLQIVLLLTILSLAPAIIMMLTSFARIVVVLGFTRSALSMQQVPPNAILIGLALFLTAFTMAPTWKAVHDNALQPYLAHQINYESALQNAEQPIREFMFRQTREADLILFVDLSHMRQPGSRADIPTYVLIPAFIISELKTAFTMGFLIYIPFIVIDLVVATILMSMGMMMMPPSMVSLPCKIMLFVLVDGWSLIVKSLILSFH